MPLLGIPIVLYGFRKLELTIQTLLKELTDPEATIPSLDQDGNPILDDEGNPVLVPDTTPLFSSVLLTKPENLELYNGNLAILKLVQVPETGPKGMGGQADKAVFNGTVFIFINGDTDESELLCKHYTDIVGALFKVKSLLSNDLPGTQVFKPKSAVHDFRVVNVDPKNPKMPQKCTASATSFMVYKPPEKAISLN
jgi:hypothetical protein